MIQKLISINWMELRPLMLKILVGVLTTAFGAALVWAVPYEYKHHTTTDAAVVKLDEFVISADRMYAQNDSFKDFRNKAYYRWVQEDIDHLQNRIFELESKPRLSRTEKRWLAASKSQLKERETHRDNLRQIMDARMLNRIPLGRPN